MYRGHDQRACLALYDAMRLASFSDYTAPFVHKRVITACEDFLPSAAKKLLKRNFFEGKIKVNLLLDVPKLFH